MVLLSLIAEHVAQVLALVALAVACLLAAHRTLSRVCYRSVLRQVAVALAALALSVSGAGGADGIIGWGALLVPLGVSGWLVYRLGLFRQSQPYDREKPESTTQVKQRQTIESSVTPVGGEPRGTDEITGPHQPDVHAILRRSVRRRAEMRATLDAAQADHAAWSLHFRESFEVPGTQ